MRKTDDAKSTNSTESQQWFVMAPVYFQEEKIKKELDKQNIRNYLPTKVEIRESRGRKETKYVPSINSLLFVCTTESELQKICRSHPYLHYRYDRCDGVSRKMVVPSKQMEDFIRVSNMATQDLIYIDPRSGDIDLAAGTPIRIHCAKSALNGVEGIYLKMKGRRQKRVVISLNDLHAVAMVVDIDLIEKI